MKLLILVVGLLIVGIILVFTALQFQEPAEVQTKLVEQTTAADQTTTVEATQPTNTPQSVEVIAIVTEEVIEAAPIQTACEAYVERHLEDLDDAEQEMNRKLKAYDKADEIFDDYITLDDNDRDEARVDELRDNKKAAEIEYDDTVEEYKGAKRRYRRARTECELN